MERQLVVGFVCLELKDGCLGTQYSTLKEIHSREHFVVSYRALDQVEFVGTGFTYVPNAQPAQGCWSCRSPYRSRH